MVETVKTAVYRNAWLKRYRSQTHLSQLADINICQHAKALLTMPPIWCWFMERPLYHTQSLDRFDCTNSCILLSVNTFCEIMHSEYLVQKCAMWNTNSNTEIPTASQHFSFLKLTLYNIKGLQSVLHTATVPVKFKFVCISCKLDLQYIQISSGLQCIPHSALLTCIPCLRNAEFNQQTHDCTCIHTLTSEREREWKKEPRRGGRWSGFNDCSLHTISLTLFKGHQYVRERHIQRMQLLTSRLSIPGMNPLLHSQFLALPSFSHLSSPLISTVSTLFLHHNLRHFYFISSISLHPLVAVFRLAGPLPHLATQVNNSISGAIHQGKCNEEKKVN